NQGTLDLAGNTLTLTNTFHALINIEVTDGNIVLTNNAWQTENGTNVASLSASKSITLNSGTLQFLNYTGTFTRPIVTTGGISIGNNSNNTAVIGSNIAL